MLLPFHCLGDNILSVHIKLIWVVNVKYEVKFIQHNQCKIVFENWLFSQTMWLKFCEIIWDILFAVKFCNFCTYFPTISIQKLILSGILYYNTKAFPDLAIK